MYRNAILSMVFFAETSRTNNRITKLHFPLVSRMQCSILYVISIVLSLTRSGQLRSESLPIRRFYRGNYLTRRGRSCWKFWEKNPSDLERRKNDRFCLCYHHKQKFCLIYTQLGCETKTLSSKNLSSSPPKKKLNGWMNVVCYEPNSQSETRTNDG